MAQPLATSFPQDPLRPTAPMLELGIGTGKSIPHHPAGLDVLGIDISARMLARAERRAGRSGRTVRLDAGERR